MEKLPLTEYTYKDALDVLHDGVAIYDQDGNPRYINQAHLDQIGIDYEFWFNTPLHDYPAMDPPLASRTVSQEVIASKKAISGVVHYPITEKTCLISATPMYVDSDHFMIVSVIRDLTELLELQKKVHDLDVQADNYRKELEQLRAIAGPSASAEVHTSRSMELIYEKARRIAKIDVPVLILGETGVGKDYLARYLHEQSGCKGPFVKLNCNAIPANLLESEMFGYEKGAFTGANKQGKPGLLEVADNGTLFLDEIGDLPPELQVKLLGVLQDKMFTRVGSVKPIHSNFRIIAATNANLERRIEENLFREDLFYRLNVITFDIPPLRERREDIIPMANEFVREFCTKHGKGVTLGEEAASALIKHNWPGNIRELRNTMERMVILETEPVFSLTTVTNNLLYRSSSQPIPDIRHRFSTSLKDHMDNYEKKILAEALEEYKTLAKTSQALEIDISTLARKKKKYGL